MEKNTVIAIVLSTLVIVGFSMYQTRLTQAQLADMPQDNAATLDAAAADTVREQTALAAETFAALPDESDIIAEERVTIKTDLMTVTLTNRGGDIIGYELADHRDGDHGIQMADSITATNRAMAVAFGTENTPIINDCFNVRRVSDYEVHFSKSFAAQNPDGSASTLTLVKQYTFVPDEYVFKLDILIKSDTGTINFNNAAYTLRTAPQLGPYWNTSNRYDYRTFMSSTNDKQKKANMVAGQTREYTNQFTWTAVTGKYFSTLVAPVDTASMTKAFYSTKVEENDYPNAQVMLVRAPASGGTLSDTYYVYMGPRTDKTLKLYNNAQNNRWHLAGLHFDYCQQSSGVLTWLEVALKWIMGIIYKLVPNYGVAILIMTLLLRLALYPMTKKSSLASVKMQEVQPKMQALQEKYKNNPEKLNQETQALYKEAGYNPLSGCLPLLIQFPIIMAMYNLFNNYFEFRGAAFVPGWISDLSVGDSVATLNFTIPLLRDNNIRILPIVYVIIQVIQTKITAASQPQTDQTKSMNMMMYVMPFVFFFMFYSAPSGLVLYWTFSLIVAAVQQVFINKQVKAARAELAEKKAAKPKFTARKK